MSTKTELKKQISLLKKNIRETQKDLKDTHEIAKLQIKKIKAELDETKDLLRMSIDETKRWKRLYNRLYDNYTNLLNEKQIFVNTEPQKIVNVEIKGNLIFIFTMKILCQIIQ